MFAVHAIRQTTLQVDAPVPAKQAAEERRGTRIVRSWFSLLSVFARVRGKFRPRRATDHGRRDQVAIPMMATTSGAKHKSAAIMKQVDDTSPTAVTALLDGRPGGMALPSPLHASPRPRRRSSAASQPPQAEAAPIKRKPRGGPIDLHQAANRRDATDTGPSAAEIWAESLSEHLQGHTIPLSAKAAEFVPKPTLNARAANFVPSAAAGKVSAPDATRTTPQPGPDHFTLRTAPPASQDDFVVKWTWWRTLRAADPHLA